jgi:phosphate transport system permease protein
MQIYGGVKMNTLRAKKRNEAFGRFITFLCAILVIIVTFSLVIFIASKGLTIFVKDGVSPIEFLTSTKWRTEANPPQVGALTFIIGSLVVSIFGILISAPVSISSAIFMVNIAPAWGQKLLQPVIELFVGIPSVVYGWIGLSVLVPFIRNNIGGLGFSVLAGGLVLAVMMFPTIASVAADALRAIPEELNEASLALGATRWQTIRRVLLPAAMPGLLTAIILGLARGLGEALAVQMVIGNAMNIPSSLLDPVHTMTSIITMEMGNTAMNTLPNDALWSIALLLLAISLVFILLIRFIGKKEAYK